MLRHVLHLQVNDTMNRIVNVILVLAVLYGAGALGYQTVNDALPVTVLEREVLTPEVHAGEELRIRVSFITEKLCPTHIDRFLFDGEDTRFVLPALDYQTSSAPVGQQEEYITTVSIPSSAKPGDRAKYQTIPTYQCNFVQRWFPLVGPRTTVEFSILPPRPDSDTKVIEELRDILKNGQVDGRAQSG
jgi:hypothetical protein